MSTLIFQIHIKQWDKSQRLPSDIAARAAMDDRFTIASQPAFFILNEPCLIDQHGAVRPLKKAMLADGAVKLERFLINERDGQFTLSYQSDPQDANSIIEIGCLNDAWICAKYEWRSPVEKEGEFFWQYEEITLNAIYANDYETHLFLVNSPSLVFKAEET